MRCRRDRISRAAFLVLAVAGCRVKQLPPRPPAGAPSETVHVPPDSAIPDNVMGAGIRRGRALLANTRDSLPGHVGSGLRCFSCHLKEGTQPGAFPLLGVYARFPQYRARNGVINLIEDRVNDCFERSLNGKAIAPDGRDMRDIVAYLAFLSRGIPSPGVVPGLGARTLEAGLPDTVQGQAIFAETCSRCHGPDGAGTGLAPPLWGPKSFNIGAGLARLRTAAAFIRDNMPNDHAVVLTDQHAFDVASYILARPRPDFPGKVGDWPNGDAPSDVSYPTKAATLKASGAHPKP